MPNLDLSLTGSFNEAHHETQGEHLIVVTPDPSQYAMAHEILLRNEAVHPMRDLDELRHNRLGYIDDNNPFKSGSTSTKLAFALAEGPFMRAVIYLDLSERPARDDQLIEFCDLPGNLSAMRHAPSVPLTGNFNTFCFYSVSNISNPNDPNGKGAGERLITQVHTALRPYARVMTTLSPFRGFNQWIEQAGLQSEAADKDGLFRLALKRVFAHHDRVQKFHLSNGAVIAGFHVGVNDQDTRDATEGMNMAVNYVYPRNLSILQQNAAAYRERKIITLADTLYAELSAEQKNAAQPISAAETQRKSGRERQPVTDAALQPGN